MIEVQHHREDVDRRGSLAGDPRDDRRCRTVARLRRVVIASPWSIGHSVVKRHLQKTAAVISPDHLPPAILVRYDRAALGDVEQYGLLAGRILDHHRVVGLIRLHPILRHLAGGGNRDQVVVRNDRSWCTGRLREYIALSCRLTVAEGACLVPPSGTDVPSESEGLEPRHGVLQHSPERSPGSHPHRIVQEQQVFVVRTNIGAAGSPGRGGHDRGNSRGARLIFVAACHQGAGARRWCKASSRCSFRDSWPPGRSPTERRRSGPTRMRPRGRAGR